MTMYIVSLEEVLLQKKAWLKTVEGTADNIVITTGKKYTLKFEGYFVYKDDPDKVRIRYIKNISKDIFDEEREPEVKSIYYR